MRDLTCEVWGWAGMCSGVLGCFLILLNDSACGVRAVGVVVWWQVYVPVCWVWWMSVCWLLLVPVLCENLADRVWFDFIVLWGLCWEEWPPSVIYDVPT